MEILGWLLVPLAATLLGFLWLAWHNRERKPADAERGMEHMARFREAMEKPLPPLNRPAASDGTDPHLDETGRAS